MTPPTPNADRQMKLIEELSVLLRRAMGEGTETAVAAQIKTLVMEMTGIRIAMERHTKALEQAAKTLGEVQLSGHQQQILWEEMKKISQNISWIKTQLAQDAFEQ